MPPKGNCCGSTCFAPYSVRGSRHYCWTPTSSSSSEIIQTWSLLDSFWRASPLAFMWVISKLRVKYCVPWPRTTLPPWAIHKLSHSISRSSSQLGVWYVLCSTPITNWSIAAQWGLFWRAGIPASGGWLSTCRIHQLEASTMAFSRIYAHWGILL